MKQKPLYSSTEDTNFKPNLEYVLGIIENAGKNLGKVAIKVNEHILDNTELPRMKELLKDYNGRNGKALSTFLTIDSIAQSYQGKIVMWAETTYNCKNKQKTTPIKGRQAEEIETTETRKKTDFLITIDYTIPR